MRANFSFLSFCVFLLASCSGKKDGGESSAKFEQYYVQGQRLYTLHCSNCHQQNGEGLGRVIPPLKGADYLLENLDRTACNIRYGLQGEIIVNGVDYNQPMPGNDKLTALEIAEIITYAANSWGNEAGLYSVKETEKALKACAEN